LRAGFAVLGKEAKVGATQILFGTPHHSIEKFPPPQGLKPIDFAGFMYGLKPVLFPG
jgi:hypothetical protein